MSKLMIIAARVAVALSVLFVLAVPFSAAAPVAAPAADSVSVCTWLGCKPGALSYTQDDGATTCRVPLEAAGFRGTFYVSETNTLSWFLDVSNAGHEVGAHLADHVANCTMPPPVCEPNCTLADLRLTPYIPAVVNNFRTEQIDPNVIAIEAGTGKPAVSMAYPCGSTDANRMAASEPYFLGARGYYDPYDGADFPWITDTNAAILPDAMLLNSDNGVHDLLLIDRAINEGQWAIFTMHDYCLSIDNIANNRADLWVAPVGEVLKYIKVRDAVRFGNYVKTSNSISFDAGHSLSTMQRETFTGTPLLPITFDNPVTLNADVPINNGVGGVLVDGLPVSYAVTTTITGTRGVLFTTTLGITRHVAITLTGPNTVQVQNLSARSDSELGQNLGWLLAIIVMGIGGVAGLVKANRRRPRRTTMRGHD